MDQRRLAEPPLGSGGGEVTASAKQRIVLSTTVISLSFGMRDTNVARNFDSADVPLFRAAGSVEVSVDRRGILVMLPTLSPSAPAPFRWCRGRLSMENQPLDFD